ncbi:glycoside hydrolase family 97 protein [Aquirufa sp. ROCK2-A2]
MKYYLVIILPFFTAMMLNVSCQQVNSKKIIELSSPNKKIKFQLFTENDKSSLQYTLDWKDSVIIEKSNIGLLLEGEEFDHLTIRGIQKIKKDTLFSPVIASKRKTFRDRYNALLIQFDQPLALEIRMYDEGLSYRWIGKASHSLKVLNETFDVNPKGDPKIYYAPYQQELKAASFLNYLAIQRDKIRDYFKVGKKFESHFETQYRSSKISESLKNTFYFVPALIQTQNQKYLVIAESDVIDYPGMILQRSSQNSINAHFSPYPLEEQIPNDTINYSKLKSVTQFAKYIAKTKGQRNFPWRVIAVTDNPASIPASDLILKLASPSEIKGDLSWIKPGQITDEWLVNTNLFNVPFESGKNTATYQYYIDFAKKFGLEYIMIDEGWYLNGNLKKLNKDLNVDSIVSYAKTKGIGVGLWFNAVLLEENLEETLSLYASKGIQIIMIDFINRNDQKAMNFYAKMAKACAKYHLMINIHSAPAPAGFEITYPNAISREGVMGSEWNGWSTFITPNHNLTIPFTRMFSGSLDYEPGLLDNSAKNGFRNIDGRPMSQGTRAHQIAMYVIYDSPLQYFVGNPSQGFKEPEMMHFIGDIPTTWDETIVLKGKPGEYIVTARQKDGIWYLGAMNNWTERIIRIDLSKLGLKRYQLNGITDGVNSNKYASDYVMISQKGDAKEKMTIHLSKGGGGVWRIETIKSDL